jgi:hypothetical protein
MLSAERRQRRAPLQMPGSPDNRWDPDRMEVGRDQSASQSNGTSIRDEPGYKRDLIAGQHEDQDCAGICCAEAIVAGLASPCYAGITF